MFADLLIHSVEFLLSLGERVIEQPFGEEQECLDEKLPSPASFLHPKRAIKRRLSASNTKLLGKYPETFPTNPHFGYSRHLVTIMRTITHSIRAK